MKFHQHQAKKSTVSPSKNTVENQLSSGTCTSSVIALSGGKSETIEIEESEQLFGDDCSETFCEKVESKVPSIEPVANKFENYNNKQIVDNHLLSCRQCKVFMDSNTHLTLEEKVGMVDRCKYPTRPDTDSEFWNPRFLPTPESQKQETLIDDRWGVRDTML